MPDHRPSLDADPLRTAEQSQHSEDTAERAAGSSLAATPDGARPAPRAPDAFALPGYEILGVLGRGGMGIVYKARQLAANRIVALKMVLRGEHASATDVHRFRREAEAVARLSHPNIVSVYEVGTHQGVPYFTLEYVAGGNLAEQLAGNPRPARSAAELVERLAHAMHHAHRNGIVHRDLKPGNILLTASNAETGSNSTKRDGTQAESAPAPSPTKSTSSRHGTASGADDPVPSVPKITDFGLARQLEVEDGQTNTGAVMGTPSYMAPEQALGMTRAIGPPADIYALGAILYECLTGAPPFKGASKLETLDQVRRRDPVPVRQVQPTVPRDLETICLKCLAKEPAKRYPTAGALADDLRRFLQNKPIVARPVGIAEQAWKWTRRNPIVAGLLAAVLVVLFAGITATSGAYANAVRARARAEENETRARENETRANETAEQLKLESAEVVRQTDIANREAERRGHALAINSVRLTQSSWKERDTHPETAHVWLNEVAPEFRRWEWYYLNRSLEGSAYTLSEHGDEVRGLAFTRDGTKMLSVSGQKIVLWDARSCRPTFRLIFPSGAAPVTSYQSAALDPEGRRIVSSFPYGGEVREVATRGSVLVTVDQPAEESARFTFNPEGTVLASVRNANNQGASFQLRKPEDGRLLHEWTLPRYAIRDFSFSPDGREVALAGTSGTAARIAVCDYRTGRQRAAFTLNQAPGTQTTVVLRVVWTPDGANLACLLGLGKGLPGAQKVVVLDAASGKIKFDSPALAATPGTTLACSPDGLTVATGSAQTIDRLISVWNVETGQLVREFKGHLGPITSLEFSPDGSRLVSGSTDGSIKCWDVGPNPRPFLLGRSGERIDSIAVRTDGAYVAAVHGTPGVLDLWNVATGQRERSWEVSKAFALRVLFSPDGREIITGGEAGDGTGEIKTWDASTGRLLSDWKTDFPCLDLALSPDGTMLVSAGGNLFSENATAEPKHELKLWDRRTGQLVHALSGGAGTAISTVAFHPDGTRFMSGSPAKLTFWDVKSGRALRTVPAYEGPIYQIVCSPDGKYVVTAGNEGLRLWSAGDGEWVADLEGHRGLIRALTFSPDGARLVSSDNRETVRVWDLRSREEVLKLDTPGGMVTGLAFAHDNCLLGARSDGRIHVWPAPTRVASTRLEGHRFPVRVTAFSPNNSYFVSGNRAGPAEIPSEIKLWDTATGRLLHSLSGLKSGGVHAFAFNAQSTLVAASNEPERGLSEEVVVWDVVTGRVVQRISNPDHGDFLLGFSTDGTRLLSGTGSAQRSWDLASGQLLPPQPGDETQGPSALSFNQEFLAFPTGTRIRLVRTAPPSTLEATLRRDWNEPVIPERAFQSRAHQQAGRAYAAWFEAERRLFEIERPKPEDFRFRDDALLVARKQFPKHLALARSAARLLIARPETKLNPDDLIPILADPTRTPSPAMLSELGGLHLRDGKPDDAIAALKKALDLRGPNAPPIEELLLALAYRAKDQLEDARRWADVAAGWWDREGLPSRAALAAVGGGPASLAGGAPGDPPDRPINWETARTLRELRNELANKLKQ